VRLTAALALEKYRSSLTDYEAEEIKGYGDVYYLGGHAQKIKASRERPDGNFGFDEEDAHYKVVQHDHLRYQYKVRACMYGPRAPPTHPPFLRTL